MSLKLARSVVAEADIQLCMRYVGAGGGGEAAALSLYPFTSTLLTNMRVSLVGRLVGWWVGLVSSVLLCVLSTLLYLVALRLYIVVFL